jgi:hypothetical protein
MIVMQTPKCALLVKHRLKHLTPRSCLCHRLCLHHVDEVLLPLDLLEYDAGFNVAVRRAFGPYVIVLSVAVVRCTFLILLSALRQKSVPSPSG